MDLMFEAYLTYESSSQLELNDIPRTKEPVWILGRKYNALTQVEEIRQDIRSRLWFSYRKGFISIGDSGLTSDKGWGCMLRCGQMVLAQALLFQQFGRDWKWTPVSRDQDYLRILRMFEDRWIAPYSIHKIALTGALEGKQVGDWFGPNTVAQVLKKLVACDKSGSSLTLHVPLDNILFVDDVKNVPNWKPLVLIVPLRLGLSEFNPTYLAAFKSIFTFQQSLGVIGGKPNHALYFIGCVGGDVIYLDPHTTQPMGLVRNKETETEGKIDGTYHCSHANRLHISQMDPSVAMCFFCKSEFDFDNLCQLLKTHMKSTDGIPLLEVYEHRSHVYGGCSSTSSSSTMEQSIANTIQDELISLPRYHKSISNSSSHTNSEDSDDFELIG